MNDVVIATTSADAEAVEAVTSHHAELAGGLTARVAAVLGTARAGQDVGPASAALVAWARTELLPHAKAEEEALYPAGLGLPALRALVEAMVAEHRVLVQLVDRLTTADTVDAVASAAALQVLFETHLAKENDQLLPALAQAPDVSLAQLLQGMHQALAAGPATEAAPLGVEASEPAGHGDGHSCGCGGHDEAGDPELDARAVPHAIRHATIFGALDAVRPGGAMVLIAPHDPLPLLGQIEQRHPGVYTVSYLERGPEAWRLRFARQAS